MCVGELLLMPRAVVCVLHANGLQGQGEVASNKARGAFFRK